MPPRRSTRRRRSSRRTSPVTTPSRRSPTRRSPPRRIHPSEAQYNAPTFSNSPIPLVSTSAQHPYLILENIYLPFQSMPLQQTARGAMLAASPQIVPGMYVNTTTPRVTPIRISPRR